MGLLAKLRGYSGVMSRRDKSRPLEPMALLRKRLALMLGVNGMELAQMLSGRVDSRLKSLAQIKTSALVGCPF
jgi:hypothetical protein